VSTADFSNIAKKHVIAPHSKISRIAGNPHPKVDVRIEIEIAKLVPKNIAIG
jgi:hypothetical protein